MENALNTTQADSATPSLPLVAGCRVQVWTGEVGQLVDFLPDGCVEVHIDGELTISGRPQTWIWQAWQVRRVVLLPAA